MLYQKARVALRHEKDVAELCQHDKFLHHLNKSLNVLASGGILVYLGDRGTGKTQMASTLIKLVCMQKQSALYYRCREIGMKMREAYDINSTLTEMGALDTFTRPQLLVIDECQEKPDKDWESRTLTMLVDERYAHVKPTILIANCGSDKDFLDLMGASIYDRIKEGGGALMFDWTSFREQ